MSITPHPDLSLREQQILRLAAHGLTDQGIANRLGITRNTVSTYWGRIRTKLGPVNRAELVAHYVRERAGEVLEKLRSENRKLVEDIERQAQQELELQATLDMFQNLCNSAPDTILVVDESGRIRMANHEAGRMFGYEPDVLVHKPIRDLVPQRFRTAHAALMQTYMDEPSARRMGQHQATVALRSDGSEFPIAATLNATQTSNGMLVTCIVRDIEKLGWAIRGDEEPSPD